MQYIVPAGTPVKVSSWLMPRIRIRQHATQRELTFTECIYEDRKEYCFHEGDWYIQVRKEFVKIEANDTKT